MRTVFSCILLSLLAFSQPALALFGSNDNGISIGSNNDRFVPVDQAFPFDYQQQGDTVYLDWAVKQDYYLYQERISINGENVAVKSIQMEDGQPYQDEFFGDVNIYTEPLFVEVKLQDMQLPAKLKVQYQGCAKAGFCYPPETRFIDLVAFTSDSSNNDSPPGQPLEVQNKPTANTTTPPAPIPASSDNLTDKLANNWWTPALFLLLGIGLAFTPCVLPMYPILTGIVLGGGKLSQQRAFGLSFIYVQGMALTYTLLGLVVASAGMQFQAAMQHPYVLISLSVLFVALAMSMFGVYTLQLPSSVQTWLNEQSNKQKGGNGLGVFVMGAISGLVCSPCTTAPLSGALLYVAQTGDLLTGAITLYALAIGMGIPLIAVAVFGNKLLPKAGNWMDRVKVVFGFILLAAPIFLLERILPELWSTLLWSTLGIVAFGWLYHIKNALPFGGWKQSVVGIVAVLGLFASAQPALHYYFQPQTSATHAESKISFVRVTNVTELESELAKAKSQGKPVMFDYYADWCVACKEFEKYTFHDSNVEPKLADFVLLQADVTKNQPDDIALLQHLKVLGLPTIEFWDAQGNHVPNARLTGFIPAPEFLNHLSQQQLISN
ncbi:protein-disulfide reductase DsbD [Vibrio maerlii]|uniref:protein-disulfide reductase DsbD n=1 Tax=Vibrio maerlii TaxID=2231648 RepID=UPI000E3C4B46|nr:protein-disulfide reductase DsbD [Vibrio maerlii]